MRGTDYRKPQEPRVEALLAAAGVVADPDPNALYGAADAIYGLSYSTCHWPIGDPLSDGFRFCNAASGERVYCAAHSFVAYTPRKKKTPGR